MKNALILHGTGNSPEDNWFQWLKKELETKGYEVWVPLLPQNDTPNIKRYNEMIFANKGFTFNEDTILIGHSSGAVEILGLLQNLPSDITVKAVYMVGVFKDSLGEKDYEGLFEVPFDFERIKARVEHIVYIHSENDPYCPLAHAEYLREQTGGDLIIIPEQKHFSISTMGEKYKKFPSLLEEIKLRT